MKKCMLLVILFAMACNTQPAQVRYKIIYNVAYDTESDNYEIFSMDPDGQNKKNISNAKGVDWAYSAFEDKLYFVSDRDTTHRMYFLYEMDAFGANIKKISNIRLKDSWLDSRHNGSELIVNPHKTVDSVFYLINRDGDILQKIDSGLAFQSDPCFIENGSRIIFRGAHKKSKREKGFTDEIYVMNLDGSGLEQLTFYPKSDTTAEWYAYKAGPPRWHPEAKMITYQSKQNGRYSLFATTLDGRKQWRLTDNLQQEGWHHPSSDGKSVAIEFFDTKQSQFHIGVWDRKTGTTTILTDSTYKYQQAPLFVEVKN